MRRLILTLSLLAFASTVVAQQRLAPPKVTTLTGLNGNQGDIVNLVGTGDYLCSTTTCTTSADWQQISSGGAAPTFDTVTLNGGGALRTDTTTAHTALLQAYDNNTGPGYVTFCTFTNGNTPSLDCSPPAGGATIGITSATLTTPVLSGTVTGTYTLGGTPTLASAAGVPYVAGVAAGYKLVRGTTALDGSNPTTVATGLTTVVACTGTLLRTTALTSGTAELTHDTASGANVDWYGWVIAGTASTGTETFEWVCVGT